LPYPYKALEPYISEEIMTIHHTKHHQTYVNALNAAEAAFAQAPTPKERIALLSALKFNGGGELSASIYVFIGPIALDNRLSCIRDAYYPSSRIHSESFIVPSFKKVPR